jgi:outer membrane protein OmpA-like peptidoglycan-associated protein
MKHAILSRTGLALAIGGLILAGCGSPPRNANLDQARIAYDTTARDPTVQRSAPRELEDSQEFLQSGQLAWENGADTVEVDHNAYMAHRYAQIAQQRAATRNAAFQATAASRVITLGNMLFASGKADLTPEGQTAVSQLATYLKNYPDQTITIIGHTDSTGSAALNATLSAERAAAVQTALAQNNIDPARIQTRGVGPASPIASNGTPEGRQMNRRVEVALGPGGETATGGMQ